METSSSSDYQEKRVGPTVSKDKWVNHAKAKLARGYVLIIGKQRRNANFYLRAKGFEMCPYNVAKQLVKDGIVVEAGEHPLGTMYRLAEEKLPIEIKHKPVTVIDPEEPLEELEDIIDEAEEGEQENEDEAAATSDEF
ncbi:MAG TPA: hypothetical protein VFG50_05620 [Rhodothermales bacterium]|nr:hypothetical protein [Rhodothermales bacterium]